jgi:hypothetical protein
MLAVVEVNAHEMDVHLQTSGGASDPGSGAWWECIKVDLGRGYMLP